MKIHIPTPLRAYTSGQETVTIAAQNVGGALVALTTEFPALRQHLLTPEGKTRSFVNLYLNDDDVRYLPEKDNAPVSDSDELTIIPSIAGGCCL
jgi:molybdopterin synthase sulfur carrier subunit